MLKKLFISVISWNWENISKSGPKFNSIFMKNWILMKRCIGSGKPHTIVFGFFVRYYDAEEVIRKRISWNWENILKSGPKINRPIIMKNWNFDEKVHRICKTSHDRFSLFRKMLRCWRIDSEAHFLKLRKYLNIWAQLMSIIMKNWIFDEKVHQIRKTSQNRISLFRKILRCWRSNS